jgi:hypothetical protein
MIMGTQSLHRFASKISQEYLVICGLTGMGMAVLLTALFGKLVTTAIGMLGLAFGAAFIMVPSQTLLQAGPVAERAGIRNLYLASTAMLLTIGAVGFAKSVSKKPQNKKLNFCSCMRY